jgi:hypothetical protein
MRQLALLPAIVLFGCPGPDHALPGEVRISEVQSSNLGGGPGAARDELGEYDDWIELENLTDRKLSLSELFVSDFVLNPERFVLAEGAELTIEPRGFLLLFADGETHQGPAHLPFKLSS